MYLMSQCQNCQREKLNCTCQTNKGLYWEETTKKFYTWIELKEFYKKKAKNKS